MAFTLALHADDDGTLHAKVSAVSEGRRFRIKRCVLVVRLWREALNVVRASLYHPASGATAYLQGSDELAGISRALNLELRPTAEKGVV